MLNPNELAAMTDEQLAQLSAAIEARSRANLSADIASGGASSTWRRGAAKLRVRQVRKPDFKRQDQLREERRVIFRESEMVRAELRRRADAEKARA